MRRLLLVLLILVLLCGTLTAGAADNWKGIPAILRLEERLEVLNGADCATEIIQAASISRTHQFEVHIRCDKEGQ